MLASLKISECCKPGCRSRAFSREILSVVWTAILASTAVAQPPGVDFEQESGLLRVTIGRKPFCTFVYNDDQVLRPYFCNVRGSSGVQVTRNHPPLKGQDRDDHATMHPGIWLAFGDLSGADFWRNKGRVRFDGFTSEPSGGPGSGTFVYKSTYLSGDEPICTEICTTSIDSVPHGYLLTLDSTFTPVEEEIAFGDQEEMGLGIRVATSLTTANGGLIVNSDGQSGEAQAWGKQAKWCACSRMIDGKHTGVLLMPHPDNFRESWFHVRDYGLLVANPFGRNAFTRAEKSSVQVTRDKELRLRFGVLVFADKTGTELDFNVAYQEYVRRKGTSERSSRE